jgi:cobalt-zinc-cadmium efflux system protein
MHKVKSAKNKSNNSEKNISYAFFLNLGFTIIEIIGGLLTNSIAILADAVHDFGDSVSLGLAWYLEKFSKKTSDYNYSYGYKRFSLLGAMINSVILLVGSILILFETIPRIYNPQETNVVGMFLLSILGIIINGAAVIRLRRGNTISERVVSLHLWEDVLGWIAILIGSVVMYFFDVPVVDPILSVFITFYILYHVFRNIKATMRIFLQGTPVDIDVEEIKRALISFEAVDSVHDFHSWSVDGNYNIVTTHVVLNKGLSMEELAVLKKDIRENLNTLNIAHATIEFEVENEMCSLENCSH